MELFLILSVCVAMCSSQTFVGTTRNHNFTCHCRDNRACTSARGADSGFCSTGCDDQTLPWAPWSGPGCQIGNVAYGKTASHHHSFFTAANKAIDGNRNSNNGSVSYGYIDYSFYPPQFHGAWWRVDLAFQHVITSVTVIPMHGYQINSITVTLSSLSQCNLDSENNGANAVFSCGSKPARFVLITQSVNKYSLGLAEVNVQGYEYYNCSNEFEGSYYYGPGCLMDCHCTRQCDAITGMCSSPGVCHKYFTGYGGKCDVELPRLGNTPQPTVLYTGGLNATIDFQPTNTSSRTADYYRIEYRDETLAATWQAYQDQVIDRNPKFHIRLPAYHTTYHLRVVPYIYGHWNIPGEPSPVVEIHTRCNVGYYGDDCMSRVPSIADRSIQVELNNDGSIVVDFSADEYDGSYKLTYILQYRLKGSLTWKNQTLVTRRRRSIEVDVIFYSNSQYEIRIIPLLHTNTWGIVAGTPTTPKLISTGCTDEDSSVYQYYEEACSNWCNCTDNLCLLEDGYCNSVCDDCNTPLPTRDTTDVTLTATHDTISLTLSGNAGDSIAYKVLFSPASKETEQINETLQNNVVHDFTQLLANTEYKLVITPILESNGKKYYSKTFLMYETTSNKGSSGANAAMIGGILAVILFFLTIAALLVILYKRRHQKASQKQASHHQQRVEYVNTGHDNRDECVYVNGDEPPGIQRRTIIDPEPPSQRHLSRQSTTDGTGTGVDVDEDSATESVYEAVPSSTGGHKPLKVSGLKNIVAMFKKSKDLLAVEYGELGENEEATTTVASLKNNHDKHRFLNLKAYDHSRVILDTVNQNTSSNYINASYISGYGKKQRQYVASQAPRKNTINDMWRMIWQHNINTIIMITRITEGNAVKCQQYWPKKKTQSYGHCKVELLSTKSTAFHTQRSLMVSKGGESRKITHLQFTQWPDHDVPTNTTELLEFYYLVKSLEHQQTGPLLVHCSAGVGRTGTFIAIDCLLSQAQQTGTVDVPKCVWMMRRDRKEMVQTVEQYGFIYDVLLDALSAPYEALTKERLFQEHLHLTKLSNAKKRYEALEKLKPNNLGNQSVALLPENLEKNQDLTCVPSDDARLYLTTPIEGCNDYINAVLCDTYLKRQSLILTQIPLPHTRADMWRLVYDHGVAAVVLLDDTSASDTYWPQQQTDNITYGPLRVELQKEAPLLQDEITVRDFLLHKKNCSSRTICQWQIHMTDGDLVSRSNITRWLHVYDLMTRWQDQDPSSHIIIQCHQGNSKSSVFAVMCSVLEKLAEESVVDLDFAIKRVRRQRPEAITDATQYQLLYKIVQLYIQDKETGYYNM